MGLTSGGHWLMFIGERERNGDLNFEQGAKKKY
jgi:hypothetical protein